jgi:hypothetical protein
MTSSYQILDKHTIVYMVCLKWTSQSNNTFHALPSMRYCSEKSFLAKQINDGPHTKSPSCLLPFLPIKKNNKTVVNGKRRIWVVDKIRLLKHLLTKRMQFHLLFVYWATATIELVDNMDETQDNKQLFDSFGLINL